MIVNKPTLGLHFIGESATYGALVWGYFLAMIL